MAEMSPRPSPTHTAELLDRRWLSGQTFEIALSRPPGLSFTPGQHVRLIHQELSRGYSLTSAPADTSLTFCVRQVPEGQFSPWLAQIPLGSRLDFSGPYGHFVFRPSPRPAVWVATGVGVAPFVSMVRSGVTGFSLLHGVRTPADLYYQDLLRAAARRYVPCLSEAPAGAAGPADAFHGRVSDYLAQHLAPGRYDFYLCGRADMIRDVTFLIDDLFPEPLVYTEIFY